MFSGDAEGAPWLHRAMAKMIKLEHCAHGHYDILLDLDEVVAFCPYHRETAAGIKETHIYLRGAGQPVTVELVLADVERIEVYLLKQFGGE